MCLLKGAFSFCLYCFYKSNKPVDTLSMRVSLFLIKALSNCATTTAAHFHSGYTESF